MNHDPEPIPAVTDDPVMFLILSGKANSLDEAEEMYLDQSLPQILELLKQPISNEALAPHPLFVLLRRRGSRCWEDSLL